MSNVIKEKMGLWDLFVQPFKLTLEEKLAAIKWFVGSIGFGMIPIWLPPLLRALENGSKYDQKIFVLNGSLMAFLVVILVERIFSLYSKVTLDRENNEGQGALIERKSKNMILIFCMISISLVIISATMYIKIVMEGSSYEPYVQWPIFLLGALMWFYLLCMTINSRWEEAVNEGYTIQKDNEQRDGLVQSLDKPNKETKDGMKI